MESTKEMKTNEKKPKIQSASKLRVLTGTAMLAAVATGLMFIDFSVPFMPSFIKLDVSELPALLAGFAYGPVSGICVCLVKNIFNLLFHGTTGGAGELCNFLLGVCFVVPAALIYRRAKSRKTAVIGAVVGAVSMAVLSVPLNYFISYPVYEKFMPIEAIINMYQEILPSANGLLECLLIFNMPFTFFKGVLVSALCFIIYKPLSPVLHGRKR
ncbi:MAG: ECF transporter S component [Acutalibacteraceae bacterium]